MLRRKLYFVIALVALLVIGFLATSLTSYYVATESLAQQISEQTLPLTSDNIYSEIQRDLLRPILISSLMASDTFLRDWVMDGEREVARIEAYLEEIQERYATITAFFVSDYTLNYYHPTGVIKQVDDSDPEDAWYFRVRELREPYEINVDWDTADRGRLSIFVNYRVFDYQGEYLGVTGVGLSVESVTQLIDNYQQRYGRTIYFVDRLGNITLTAGGAEQMAEERLQQRPGLGAMATRVLSQPSASFSYRNPEGEEVYVNSRLVPEFGWHLVVEQQGSLGSERIQNTLWINVSLSLAIMALVLFAAHFTLQAYQRRLEEMATTDRLTGAANRHVFEPLFNHVVRSSSRQDKPVSLIIIDIDHFKRVNDTYGHSGGDLVLRAVADTIRAHIRDSDAICRWGGEEFMLLLDNCPIGEAAERAEAIREAVKGQPIPFGRDEIRVTLSLGVAQYHKGESLELLVNRVDTLLYRAKDQGRDRVCLAD